MLSYWHRNVAGAGLVVLGLGEALYMLTSAEFWITGFSEMDIDTGTIEGRRTLEQWHNWVGATQAVLTLTAIFTLLAAFRASRGHVDYLVLLGMVHAAGAVAAVGRFFPGQQRGQLQLILAGVVTGRRRSTPQPRPSGGRLRWGFNARALR